MVQRPPPPHDRQRMELDVPTKNLPAPEGANWFNLTRLNADVQLMVGYVDPLAAHRVGLAILAGEKNVRLAPDVTHRFMLSVGGFLYLREQVEEIFRKMKEKGLLETADSAPAEPGSRGPNG